MKAALVAFALALVVLSADRIGASADSSPSNPQQQLAVIDQIRAQLGSNLADGLAAQQQLQQSLEDNAAQQQVLRGKIAEVVEKIADLDRQIAEAKRREAILADRIEAERAQLRELARAIYVSPGSVLVQVAEAQSLSDLLTRIADLNVAGARAGVIKNSLKSDLADLQKEREKEEVAREEQVKQRNKLSSELAQLQALQAQEQASMEELQQKIWETRSELARLNTQSTQLAQQVADWLQQHASADLAAVWPEPVLVRAALWQLPALPHRDRPGRALRLTRVRGG